MRSCVLVEKANEIFEQVHNENFIPVYEKGDIYKNIVQYAVLKRGYGIEAEDLKGFKWGTKNDTVKHGEAILKYTDSKVDDFSDAEVAKEQILDALSDIRGKSTEEINSMYETRKEVASNYLAETVLEESAKGLANATKFLDDQTKKELAKFSIKFEKGRTEGFKERIENEVNKKLVVLSGK